MENKKIYIGLGVLAVAGIAYYMWKKNKPENKSEFLGLNQKNKIIISNNPLSQIVPMPSTGKCPKGSSPVNVSAPNQIPDIRCNYARAVASPENNI